MPSKGCSLDLILSTIAELKDQKQPFRVGSTKSNSKISSPSGTAGRYEKPRVLTTCASIPQNTYISSAKPGPLPLSISDDLLTRTSVPGVTSILVSSLT